MPFTKKSQKQDRTSKIKPGIGGASAAFIESPQATAEMTRETLLQLRQEVQDLRRKVADANTSHENINVAGPSFHMTGQSAVATLERKSHSTMKRLDAAKHTNRELQHRLDELKEEYKRKKAAGRSRRREIEEDAMNLRALDNNLEKMRFKRMQAENIMRTYDNLRSNLLEESNTYTSQLDSLEADILKHRQELHKQQTMTDHAQQSKEAAKNALQQQRELIEKKRKERNHILASCRETFEESKARFEKASKEQIKSYNEAEQVAVKRAMQYTNPVVADEEEEEEVISSILSFEEVFRRIKDVFGVTDVQGVVDRFASQEVTIQHLLQLKEDNEELLQHLKGKKELLIQQLEDVKYSGEAELRERQMLESEQRLQAQQQRCDAAEEHHEHLLKTFASVRAAVEHLGDKLQHIPLSPEKTVTEVPRDSDEYVVVLMTQCKKKLKALCQGEDAPAITEMEEDEIEEEMPAWNTRIKFPEDESLDDFSDEDEDECDIITREDLKRQAELSNAAKLKEKNKGKTRRRLVKKPDYCFRF